LFSLSFYSILHYTTFQQNKPIFNKYPAFAYQYVHSGINDERLADFSPLYLWLHVFAQKCLSNPKEVILWFQLILMAGAAVLLFLLLRFYFSNWIAFAGTLAFIINPSIIVYSGIFEPEVLLIFFLLAFFVSLIQKSRFWTCISGVAFSLILLLRLNLLPVVFIVPLFFYLNGARNKILFQRIILFTVPVIFTLMLLTARNYSITGTFSPAIMNPGCVFFEGNNPNANGWHVVYPPMVQSVAIEIPHEVDRGHIAYRLISRRISGKPLSVAEVNSYWAGKAFNFITDHPVYWGKLVLRKLYAVFNSIRLHDIDQVNANDHTLQKSNIPAIPFGLISAMAIIGLFLSLRFWRERMVLYAVFICQICVMLITYASDRQRISIVALFIFFAASLLYELTGKNLSVKQKITAIIAVLILFTFFSLKDDRIKEDLYLRDHVEQAHKLMIGAQRDRKEGRLPQASQKKYLLSILWAWHFLIMAV
jgi:hypothetical protein